MPVPSASPADAPPTRAAATVVLLRERDAAGEIEVLMLRRHAGAGFAANLWVFPGGIVDATDATLPQAHWRGIDPEALATRFAMPAAEVLARHVAAVRETFEEAGVLLASHTDGSPPDLTHPDYIAFRRDLNDRSVTADLEGFLRDHDLILDLGHVTYWQRWVTPIQEPRRYDTSFFVARVPEDAAASQDDVETTEARWMTAREALDDPGFAMIVPTIKTLEQLADAPSIDHLLHRAGAQVVIVAVQPHIIMDDDGGNAEIVLPDDDRYPHELYR